MKLSELLKMHGDCKLKDGFMDFVIVSKKGKIYSVDELENGTAFYYVDTFGGVQATVFGKSSISTFVNLQGNMFWDEQSARKESKRREVCHKVEKYSYRFSKEEWENQGIVKSFPYYDYNFKKISIGNCTFFRHKNLYFKSKEDIEKAIDEVGEEDFIKYFLGVEVWYVGFNAVNLIYTNFIISSIYIIVC